MKRLFAILILALQTTLAAEAFQFNFSYDTYKGLPDGTWTGNDGFVALLNSSHALHRCLEVQVGGSAGVYNWDSKEYLIYSSSDSLGYLFYFTGGFSTHWNCYNLGIVYDRMAASHYGVHDTDPQLDQLRLRGSYSYRCEEFGLWATVPLSTSEHHPFFSFVSYKAIGQVNLFWSHLFCNSAKASLWVGVPYTESVLYSGGLPGTVAAGFSLRAPITARLSVEGYGSYMGARRSGNIFRNKNRVASMRLGLTYSFLNGCSAHADAYQPVANHSSFMVDPSRISKREG